MSVQNLTEDGEFKISTNVGEKRLKKYKAAFKGKKVTNYIARVKKTSQDLGMELKKSADGMGSGIFCGEDGVKKNTIIGLCTGLYQKDDADKDTKKKDYVIGVEDGDDSEAEIEDGKERKPGLEINGINATKAAYEVSFMNHSCKKYNAVIACVKIDGVKLMVVKTNRNLEPGEQVLINYNEEPGNWGYWKPYSYVVKKHPRIPPNQKIIRCLCNFPGKCPYNFARIVNSTDPPASDSQAVPERKNKRKRVEDNTDAVKMAVQQAAPKRKRKCKLSEGNADADEIAVQSLLSMGGEVQSPDIVPRPPDIVLPWSEINVSYEKFQTLDENSKRLWFHLFDSNVDQIIKITGCRGDKGFFGMQGFVVPADKCDKFNASQFPSVSHLRRKMEMQIKSYGVSDLQNEIDRVDQIWKTACFTEKPNPDGSLCFAYMPFMFLGPKTNAAF